MDYISDRYGSRCTYLDRKLHSYDDNPAMINSNGDQVWYKEGMRHREDGPAIIYPNGYQAWCKEDKIHREDGPAVIYSNGDQEWYKEDKLHRDEVNNLSFVLPAVIQVDGHAEWWTNDVKIKECENYQPQIKSARN
jgi:hypothetical protein